MLPLPEAWKLLYMHWWTNVKAEARRDWTTTLFFELKESKRWNLPVYQFTSKQEEGGGKRNSVPAASVIINYMMKQNYLFQNKHALK